MKTQPPSVMHTFQYPISAIGCHIPIIGDPIFVAQCNWTRHFQQVTPEKFHELLAGIASDTDKLSYTDNFGLIDTITQTISLRYDMNNTSAQELNGFDVFVSNAITQRLIQMKVIRPPAKQGDMDLEDNEDAF